jgi:hypothetical protein
VAASAARLGDGRRRPQPGSVRNAKCVRRFRGTNPGRLLAGAALVQCTRPTTCLRGSCALRGKRGRPGRREPAWRRARPRRQARERLPRPARAALPAQDRPGRGTSPARGIRARESSRSPSSVRPSIAADDALTAIDCRVEANKVVIDDANVGHPTGARRPGRSRPVARRVSPSAGPGVLPARSA